MKKVESRWSGIQGTRGAKPFLARLRQVAKGCRDRKLFKQLLVIEISYSCDDESGMPNDTFYESLEQFEARGLDTLEKQSRGIFVFSETGGGQVRQFVYVDDLNAAAEMLAGCLPAEMSVQFSGIADPRWQQYKKLSQLAS